VLFARLPLIMAALAFAISALWATRVAVLENHAEDLFIYTAGAGLAVEGRSPYDLAALHELVEAQYPGDPNLTGNNGFFLSPVALWIFAPFSLLPWIACKIAWSILSAALAVAVGWQLGKLTPAPLPPWATAVGIAIVVLNPMTQFVLMVGQTTILMLGLVVFGELAHRRGWKRLSCLLWGLAFFKPHLALVLLPLAWGLSGWRRTAEVAAWAGGLTLLAGLAFFQKPLFVLDYLQFVQQGHQTVEYNRATVNKQITSWNRLLFSAGGPGFELGLTGTLAGLAAMTVLVAIRSWWSSRSEVPVDRSTWLLACAGAAMTQCCQVLPYELPLLLLVLPYLAEGLRTGSLLERTIAALLGAFVAYAFVSGGDDLPYYRFLHSLVPPGGLRLLLESHRSLGTFGATALILVGGPRRI